MAKLVNLYWSSGISRGILKRGTLGPASWLGTGVVLDPLKDARPHVAYNADFDHCWLNSMSVCIEISWTKWVPHVHLSKSLEVIRTGGIDRVHRTSSYWRSIAYLVLFPR